MSKSISKFIEGNFDFLLTVKRVQTSPDKLLSISDGRVTSLSNENQNMSHEVFYTDAAQFYILSKKSLMGQASSLFENAGYLHCQTHQLSTLTMKKISGSRSFCSRTVRSKSINISSRQ